MKDAESCITVVFTGVRDPEALDNAINDAIQYPVVFKKEQNNGIIAYVVQGILPDVAEQMFLDFLKDSGMEGINIVVHEGNVFKF